MQKYGSVFERLDRDVARFAAFADVGTGERAETASIGAIKDKLKSSF
jgi:hypothetical protein